jgi:hypothetical protein
MRTTARKRTTAKKTHKPVYEPVLKLPALPYEQFLGVLLDPFCGSGTMLLAGLDHGASRVIGMDWVAKYLRTARRRIEAG